MIAMGIFSNLKSNIASFVTYTYCFKAQIKKFTISIGGSKQDPFTILTVGGTFKWSLSYTFDKQDFKKMCHCAMITSHWDGML